MPENLNLVTFDTQKDFYLYLNDFFQGGESIKSPSSLNIGTVTLTRRAYSQETKDYYVTRNTVRSYLIPFDGESDDKFMSRIQTSYYFNIVSQVVSAYADSVTSKVMRNLGALEPFLNTNVDYRENSWAEYVSHCAKMTALYGMTATVIDFSLPEGVSVNSRNDLLLNDLGPKTILVTPLAFAWMKTTSLGEVVEFAYYENFIDDSQYNAYAVLRIVTPEGFKKIQIDSLNTSKNVYTQIAERGVVLDEGKNSVALRGKLPVVFNFYERDYNTSYPSGKSLVNDLVDTARSVYNYCSWASDVHQRAAFPILTIPLARTGGVMPPKTEIAVGTNNALPYDSESGTPSFIAAPSDPTREIREHINFMIQRSYQLLGLSMVVDEGSIQSGEALKIRSREFENNAAKFASYMRKFEEKVITNFKNLLGMGDVETTIIYPKTFSIPQTAQDFANAQNMLAIPFLSVEGKMEALNQMVSIALSVDDQKLNEIIEGSKAILQSESLPPATPIA